MVFRRKVRDSYRRIRTAIARINSYLAGTCQRHGGAAAVQSREAAYARFKEINAQHMDAFKDAILAYAVYYPVVEILSAHRDRHASSGSAAIRSLRGITTLGVLVAFMQYAQRFFRPIQDLSEKYNILQSAMASGERIFKLLDTPGRNHHAVSPKTVEGPGRIEFDHVWFAYRNVPPDRRMKRRET